MGTRVEELNVLLDEPTLTEAGRVFVKSLEGFAEILDNTPEGADNNIEDLLIYYSILFKNGGRIDLTGVITEIKAGRKAIKIAVSPEDCYCGAPATYIVPVDEIICIQSLDVVTARRLRKEFEEKHQGTLAAHQGPVPVPEATQVVNPEEEEGKADDADTQQIDQ